MKLRVRFTEGATARVNALRVRTGARSNGDVVRDAVRLYEYLLDKEGEGSTVKLTDGEREVLLSLG